MLRSLAAISLLLATLPLHAVLVAGRERPITAPNLGAAPIDAVHALATDGTDFLTLWSEDSEPRQGLYASIVSEQGVPRPVAPLPLSEGFTLAHAVWTGDAYLVVYHETVLGPAVAVRLNRDARVISDRVVIEGPGFVTNLAWNGSRALVIIRNGATISGALLDDHGRALRSGIAIPSQSPEHVTAAVAGDAFLVAWSQVLEEQQVGVSPVTTVRAARISEDGEVSASMELMAPTRGSLRKIDSASSGDDVAVAFTKQTLPEQFHRLHRVTIDASTLAIDRRPDFSIEWTDSLDVITVPGGFAATYGFYPPTGPATLWLGSLRFDSSERVLVAIGDVYLARNMRVETNGRAVMAVFGDATAVGVALDASATQRKSDPQPVSIATVQQSAPVIASSGDQMLAAWIEPDETHGSVLLAQRRGADGNAIDAQPIVVTRGWISDPPAITFTGKVWLLAWRGYNTIDARVFVKRISPEGVVLDADPIDAGFGWTPALASNGTVAVLVMDQSRPAHLQLVRFSPEGNKIDSTPLTPASPRSNDPAIATNGTEFLVTWSAERTSVFGRRLAADGTPMDAAPIAIPRDPLLADGAARVASSGTDFMVAYVQWNPIPMVDPPIVDLPPPVYRVFVKRVLRNGVLADTTAEQEGRFLGEGTLPRITAFDGGYAVTFIAAEEHPADRLTLFAVPLSKRGLRLAQTVVVLRNVHSHSSDHSIAAVGEMLQIAYARVVPQLDNAHRAYLRPLTDQASRWRSVRK